MARYVVVRVALGALTIIGIVLLTFVLQFLVPGDPARRIAGPRADATVLAAVRANEHLDDPIQTQLVTYVEHVAQGDLGLSYIRRRPVFDMLAERLPATLLLATAGLLIEITSAAASDCGTGSGGGDRAAGGDEHRAALDPHVHARLPADVGVRLQALAVPAVRRPRGRRSWCCRR